MAPKKSESSAATGAGLNAARKVAAHDGIVLSPPEGVPSGRPQRRDTISSQVHQGAARIRYKRILDAPSDAI